MSMRQGPLPPPVEWAQRKNAVLLTFIVEDCKKPEIKIEANKIYFKGVGGTEFTEKKEYENTLELYGEIDPEKSKHFVGDRNVEMILLKKSEGPFSGFWPHLLKQKMKYHWLKVDFNRWKDEDDSEDEASQSPDLEEMMRQIGGGGGREEHSGLDDISMFNEKNEEKNENEDENEEKNKENDKENDKEINKESTTTDERASPDDDIIVETETDISGIDKVLLLQRLWENTNIAGFGALRLSEKLKLPFNKKLAEKVLHDYIDYFDGRPIKCDLSGDIAYTRLYDRDSSKPFKDIVRGIRVEMSELNKVD